MKRASVAAATFDADLHERANRALLSLLAWLPGRQDDDERRRNSQTSQASSAVSEVYNGDRRSSCGSEPPNLGGRRQSGMPFGQSATEPGPTGMHGAGFTDIVDRLVTFASKFDQFMEERSDHIENANHDMENLTRDFEDLQEKKDKLEDTLGEKEEELSNLRDAHRDLEEELQDQTDEVDAMHSKIAELENQIEKLQEERDELTKSVEEQKKAHRKTIVRSLSSKIKEKQLTEQLENKMAEYDDMQERAKRLQTDYIAGKKEREELKTKIANLQTEIQDMQARERTTQEGREGDKQRIKVLETELAQVQEQIEALHFYNRSSDGKAPPSGTIGAELADMGEKLDIGRRNSSMEAVLQAKVDSLQHSLDHQRALLRECEAREKSAQANAADAIKFRSQVEQLKVLFDDAQAAAETAKENLRESENRGVAQLRELHEVKQELAASAKIASKKLRLDHEQRTNNLLSELRSYQTELHHQQTGTKMTEHAEQAARESQEEMAKWKQEASEFRLQALSSGLEEEAACKSAQALTHERELLQNQVTQWRSQFETMRLKCSEQMEDSHAKVAKEAVDILEHKCEALQQRIKSVMDAECSSAMDAYQEQAVNKNLLAECRQLETTRTQAWMEKDRECFHLRGHASNLLEAECEAQRRYKARATEMQELVIEHDKMRHKLALSRRKEGELQKIVDGIQHTETETRQIKRDKLLQSKVARSSMLWQHECQQLQAVVTSVITLERMARLSMQDSSSYIDKLRHTCEDLRDASLAQIRFDSDGSFDAVQMFRSCARVQEAVDLVIDSECAAHKYNENGRIEHIHLENECERLQHHLDGVLRMEEKTRGFAQNLMKQNSIYKAECAQSLEEKATAEEQACTAKCELTREREDADWRVKALTTPLRNRTTRARERHKQQSADLAAELRGILKRVKAVTAPGIAGAMALSEPLPTLPENSKPEAPDAGSLPVPVMKHSVATRVPTAT